MLWNDEYKKLYEEVIKKKLPQSFVTMYEKNNWLHDWYLKSFYIANTGPNIQVYSAKGKSTLQMEFATSNNDKNILLIYRNVFGITLECSKSDEVCFNSPTGFGQCISNIFKIDVDDQIYHEFEFESGRIAIRCQSLGHRKVINNYWS